MSSEQLVTKLHSTVAELAKSATGQDLIIAMTYELASLLAVHYVRKDLPHHFTRDVVAQTIDRAYALAQFNVYHVHPEHHPDNSEKCPCKDPCEAYINGRR